MNGYKALRLLLLGAALSPVAAVAGGWGFLAQALMVEDISSTRNGGSLAAYYGAVGVNVFSTTSSAWCRTGLYDATHTQYLAFWDARTSAPTSFGYGFGFVAQNDTWGTNSTAMTESLTSTTGQGYVVGKAATLAEELPLADFGVNIPDTQATELYQAFITLAIEQRLAKSRRHLGAVLAQAARRRTERFPAMLVDAYAETIAGSCGTDTAQVAKQIERQEKAFRRHVQTYGSLVFSRGKEGFNSIIVNWAALTAAVWNNQGVHSVSAFTLRRLAGYYLPLADELIRDDYLGELRATADQVGSELIKQLFAP
jgi:hypothetical protein